MALSAFGFSQEYIVEQLLGIPGFVLFLCFRGFFQAWTAKKLGDNTAYLNGYMTMNPLKHINPIGFLFLIIVGFGFSNPVPTNSRNYKNIKRDSAIQIISSPLSGIILMFISVFLLQLFWFIGVKTELITFSTPYVYYYIDSVSILKTCASNSGTAAVMYNTLLCILSRTASVSVILSIFHLLPLPGLDGYRLIANFMPYRYYSALYRIEKYSMVIFIGFILLLNIIPAFGLIIYAPAKGLLNLAMKLFSLIFK